jgi:ribosomal protein S18 acetylase RimI-like enzyme
VNIPNAIVRLAGYYKRHGLHSTLRRCGQAAKRMVFASRMVVFYCDLSAGSLRREDACVGLKAEQICVPAELCEQHREQILNLWNPNLAARKIQERFERGARLWVAECEGRLAGFGWTLRGQTIEPYYFPLGPDDVHLFDFHVFAEYRGRGINPYLISQILDGSATNGARRAFIEAAEWNDAQLRSLRKSAFRRLGSVRSFSILGHTIALWTRSDTITQMHKGPEPTDQILRTARSNEQ